MNKLGSVFIDANVLIYFLDETADQHGDTISILQEMIDNEVILYTSHHVIEEVLFIVSRLTDDKTALIDAVQTISKLPGIHLVEPNIDFSFAKRYIRLWFELKLGINDALLLQIMIDNKIKYIFSFDADFIKQSIKFGITSINLKKNVS
ncbi:MAG: type II toxin-antitoxin system VapC family toxin [Patescibacteria group bacterium]